MGDVVVFDHALIHGLTEEERLAAWENQFVSATVVRANGNVDIVALGDASGKLVEMTAREKTWGLLIFHANTPPTNRALRELGIEEG